MAIIRPSALVGAISGKIGGVVFVAGAGTPFVRPRPAPLKTKSRALLLRQNFLARVINHWHTLTAAQISVWNTAAATLSTTNRLGLTKPLTGYQYYIKSNMTTNFTGTGASTTPPIEFTPLPPTSVVVAFELSGDYSITATKPIGVTFVTWGIFGYAFATDHTPGAIPRPVFLEQTTGAGNLSIDVRDTWTARFGALQLGQHFSVDLIAQVTSYPYRPITRIFGIAAA